MFSKISYFDLDPLVIILKLHINRNGYKVKHWIGISEFWDIKNPNVGLDLKSVIHQVVNGSCRVITVSLSPTPTKQPVLGIL